MDASTQRSDTSENQPSSTTQDLFGELWTKALSEYMAKTKVDPSKHRLAKLLSGRESPEDVCEIYQKNLEESRGSNTKWGIIRNTYLKPIVEVLILINDSMAETAASFPVVPGGKAILVAFGVLLAATKRVSERYEALISLLLEVKISVESLRLRGTSPTSWSKLSRNIASLILVHILDVFALATKLLPETGRPLARFMHYGHSLIGNKDMQEALQRLRSLASLESRALSSEIRVDAAEGRKIAKQLQTEVNAMRLAQTHDSLSLSIIERGLSDQTSKFARVTEKLDTLLTAEENAEIRDLLERLDRVGHADLSAQRRDACLPGTRVEVLETLLSWSADPGAPRIYWLHGMAGTGKSSISRSFAQTLRENGTLGGSYFCSRESRAELADTNRIVPTLAAALTGFDIQYKVALLSVLKRYSSEARPSTWKIELQVERLLFEPFACYMRAISTSPMPILLIDALDEASDDTTSDLLDRLTSVSSRLPIKFFLTSRPERHIRWHLDSFQYGDQLRLHDIEETIVAADIRRYIVHRLNGIVDRFRSRGAELPEGWPTEGETNSLVALSGSLFIYAFTATEHIGDRTPVKRMKGVLDVRRAGPSKHTSPLRDLDRIYAFIVKAAIVNRTSEELILTERILAAILVAREPLSLRTLARLLRSTIDEVGNALDELHAVVSVPEDVDNGSVSTLHASFGDFLVDRERVQGLMHVSLADGHRDLAVGCLDIALSDDLHFNMSQARTSFLSNEEQDITVTFGRDVQYTCKQWIEHSRQALRPSVVLMNKITAFFSSKFLFWLESLSVLDVNLLDISDALRRCDEWELPPDSSFLKVVVREACDILEMMTDATPKWSAPHVYLSLLPFMFLFPNLEKAHRASYSLTASPNFQWIDEKIAEEGYRLVACSHDEGYIAAVSGDCDIYVWSLPGGELQRRPDTSHDCPGRFVTITFSPDNTSIWAASWDGIVRIWERATGRYLSRWEGKATSPLAMAFSSDGRYLAIAEALENKRNSNWCIYLWELPISGGTLMHLKVKLQGPVGSRLSFRLLGFSPSNTRIVVGTSFSAFYGWDIVTSELCLQSRPEISPDKKFSSRILALNFLSDQEVLFGSQKDGKLRILDMSTYQPNSHPELFLGYRPENRLIPGAIASYRGPDGIFIATALGRDIYLRSIGTGDSTRPYLQGHVGHFDFISISSDGNYMISGASSGHTDGILEYSQLDHTIVVWDIDPNSERCRSAMNNDFDHFYFPDHDSGWLQGPNKELLLYIPEQYCQYLQHPPMIHRFAAGRLTIDWTDAAYGEDWTKCYIGPK
ncbi:unnamed protein product [Peniophora sp. CBMAI 1063]|nr:unnamed protein product [Peniophora sp. CBMAI 1063]